MSHSLTIADLRAAKVFCSMAEGMSEVAADNGEADRALHLDDLQTLIGNATDTATWPLSIELSPELAEAADCVLENCFDNASGMKPEDAGAEDYLFAGQVTIEPPVYLTTMLPVTEVEAKVLAKLLMNATTSECPALTAQIAEGLLEKLRHAAFHG
jgi:hypothetical protein